MPEERVFRIGELQAGLSEPGVAAPASRGGVDAGLFPTLAAWVQLPAPERRERLDRLAARGREEPSPDAQAALQTAVRLLSEIPLLSEGGKNE
jgi:hypothetical protein